MEKLPDQVAIDAWARLIRAQQLLLERVEAELKQSDLPPLRWYDVLLELHRASSKGLRQYEIGDAVLLNKYNLSRLLDRMEREGVIVRTPCEDDARGSQVKITKKGGKLLKTMWSCYGLAISDHFSQYLGAKDMNKLSEMLCQIPGVCR